MTPEQIRQAGRDAVADWPPPTPQQIDIITAILRPALQRAEPDTRQTA